MTSTEKELADLLFKNRVLFHNLLLDSKKECLKDAEECKDSDTSNALEGYATFRENLAFEIYEMDEQIMNEKFFKD